MPSITIWESIANTPWWMFVIYALVVNLCLKARNPSEISLKQLIFLPLYFFTLAAICAAISMHPTLPQVSVGLATSIVGTALGWLQFARFSPAVNLETRTLTLPGSLIPFLSLVIGTLAKFGLGISLHVNTELLNAGAYNTPLFAAFGLMVGMSIGRFAFARNALKRAAV